jgi:hypothetical protein
VYGVWEFFGVDGGVGEVSEGAVEILVAEGGSCIHCSDAWSRLCDVTGVIGMPWIGAIRHGLLTGSWTHKTWAFFNERGEVKFHVAERRRRRDGELYLAFFTSLLSFA